MIYWRNYDHLKYKRPAVETRKLLDKMISWHASCKLFRSSAALYIIVALYAMIIPTDKYGRDNMTFIMKGNFWCSLQLQPERHQGVVKCSGFIDILYISFSPRRCYHKGTCIRICKFSTSCNVWLSRYWPSNLTFTTDFSLGPAIISICGRCMGSYGISPVPVKVSWRLWII